MGPGLKTQNSKDLLSLQLCFLLLFPPLSLCVTLPLGSLLLPCHLSQVARTRFSEAGVSVADILSLCYFFERLWLQPLLATAWQKRIAAETKNSFESLLAGQNSIQQQLGWLDRISMQNSRVSNRTQSVNTKKGEFAGDISSFHCFQM